MEFTFKGGDVAPWSWHEMIPQMNDQTRGEVVNGREGSSGGLLRCAVSARINGYGHKRCCASLHHWDSMRGQHQGERDFVVFRKDGTALRFHPSWGSNKFNMHEEHPHATPLRACTQPWLRQHAWGEGAYKYYKDLYRTGTGRFDPEQGNKLPPDKFGYT